MAKIALTVTLKKNNGTNLGQPLSSGNKDTFSEAKAEIGAQVAALVAGANANAQEYTDAENAFNS